MIILILLNLIEIYQQQTNDFRNFNKILIKLQEVTLNKL